MQLFTGFPTQKTDFINTHLQLIISYSRHSALSDTKDVRWSALFLSDRWTRNEAFFCNPIRHHQQRTTA